MRLKPAFSYLCSGGIRKADGSEGFGGALARLEQMLQNPGKSGKSRADICTSSVARLSAFARDRKVSMVGAHRHLQGQRHAEGIGNCFQGLEARSGKVVRLPPLHLLFFDLQ